MAKSIKVIYNSFAVPKYPYDVELGVTYECIKDKDNYFIKGRNFERNFAFDSIKSMFRPCDGYDWGMLDDNKETDDIFKQTKQTKKPKIKKDKYE